MKSPKKIQNLKMNSFLQINKLKILYRKKYYLKKKLIWKSNKKIKIF